MTCVTHVCDIYVPYVICTYMFVCVSCVTYYTGGICRQAARHGENPVLVVKLLVPILSFGRTCKAENFSKILFSEFEYLQSLLQYASEDLYRMQRFATVAIYVS